MKYLLFLLVLSSASGNLRASDNTVSEKNIPVKKYLKKARKAYSSKNYESAVSYYEKLLSTDIDNFTYNYEIGLTYYSMDNMKIRCIPYFEKVKAKSSPDDLGDLYFFLGVSYHLEGSYDKALENYNKYLQMIESHGTFLPRNQEQSLKQEITYRIQQCENAKKAEQNPSDKIYVDGKMLPFKIELLSSAVNSNYDDYSQVPAPGDSLLYFASRRKGDSKLKDKWDNKYFEDIYVTEKTNDGWSLAQPAGEPLNTKRHDAPDYFSSDGKIFYLYRSSKKGSVFYSDQDANGKWSEPKLLEEVHKVNTNQRETSLSYTVHHNVLFVVSERRGGKGGRDIYFATKGEHGEWSELQNIGPEINTEYDEDSPYITDDGKTLYFSSKGHNSMGGYDIYSAQWVDGKWTNITNMGYPFNSPADDIYFIMDHKAETIYFSSSRIVNEYCDLNIYAADIHCIPQQFANVQGWISDASCKLTIEEINTPKTLRNIETDSAGNYQLTLKPGTSYRITYITSGFERSSSDFEVPEQCDEFPFYQFISVTRLKSEIQAEQRILLRNSFFNLDERLDPQLSAADKNKVLDTLNKANIDGYFEDEHIATIDYDVASNNNMNNHTANDPVQMNFGNVLFDFDKSSVKSEFDKNLSDLVAYLKAHPDAKAKLSGYTDSYGSDDYNVQLAKRRANAVKKYLIAKGIAADRLITDYFGEKNPVQTNDTPEGRKQNRRVEISVMN